MALAEHRPSNLETRLSTKDLDLPLAPQPANGSYTFEVTASIRAVRTGPGRLMLLAKRLPPFHVTAKVAPS